MEYENDIRFIGDHEIPNPSINEGNDGNESSMYSMSTSRPMVHSSSSKILQLPAEPYKPNALTEPPVVTDNIALLIRATRSQSHFFTGPFFDATSSPTECYYTHSTISKERTATETTRILSVHAPPYVPSLVFVPERDGQPYADYLLDFSSSVFFTHPSTFDELHVHGNPAIVHANILHVKLPTLHNQHLFLHVLDLQNIIVTATLCSSLQYIDVDNLTLTGAVFEPLHLNLPPSVTRLALGIKAPCPLYNESKTIKMPWMTVDPTRCLHLALLDMLGGASWKDGSSYACTLADMYKFLTCNFPLPELRLAMHPVELFDKSYAAILAAFSSVHMLCLRRFLPRVSSNNIVSRIMDMKSYADTTVSSTVDVRGVTEFWRSRGIQRIQLDAVYASLLPISNAKRYYMLFRSVEWEASSSKTIPVTFETEYPLAYIPPPPITEEDAATSLSVYIPHDHKIDKDPSAHIVIHRSSFATGSFLVFLSKGTMCNLPSSAILIPVDEQGACLVPPPPPTTFFAKTTSYIASYLPASPFARKNILLEK